MTTMSPPVSPEPSEGRPRATTSMSYTSHRSRRRSSSASKPDLTEDHKDKKRLNTKADPTQAINEATPVEQAQEESTVEDLRSVMHKDNDGNVITDPDRSNPTRHRLERPLDTIRAFHAAAEGTSSRRSSYTSRPGSQVGYNGDTRRASYYSQNGYSPQAPRMSPGGGYYRNSAYGMAPQSTVEESPGASQMYARGSMRQPTHPHARQPYGNHNGYQNGYHNGEMPMSTHSYQQSYDAMTSGSEEYTKSTNPSSQNSSYDKLHQLRTKPEEFPQENPYAKEIQFNHVSPTQPFSPYDVDHRTGQITPPAAPSKGFVQLPANGFAQPPANNPKQPIKLNGTTTAEITPPTSPKKQSWIKRRFSKRAS